MHHAGCRVKTIEHPLFNIEAFSSYKAGGFESANRTLTSMKQILSMVLVLVMLGGAALLNPSEDHHKEAIVALYKDENPISGALGIGHVLAEATTYHNYVLYSTTTLGEEKISTGYVGLVDVRSLNLAQLPDVIIEHLPEDVRRRLGR